MSNKEEKQPWGFRTASTELQDKFEKLSKEVEGKEKTWRQLVEWSFSKAKEANSKLTGEANIVTLGWLVLAQAANTIGIIGLLGQMLANVEKRVVECEKSIDKLHLKVK